MKNRVLQLLLVFTVIFAACDDDFKNLEDGLYANLETDNGSIIMKLYPEQVPLTVANFITLAKGTNEMVPDSLKGKKYYDGLGFHRVVPDFIVQGGDPSGTGSGPLPGYRFRNEINTSLKHDSKGISSMANGGGNATNGSQFFITHRAIPHLNGFTNTGDFKDCSIPGTSCHSVFGKVVQGLEVLDSIGQYDLIKKITIIRKGDKAKEFDAVEVFNTEMAKGPELEKARKEKIQAAEKVRYENFLKNKDIFYKKMGVDKATKLASGVQVITYKKGKGKKFNPAVKSSMHYSVYLGDGKLIQSNVDKDPFQFTLSERPMIAGVTEALKRMNIGGKVRLFIPYYLAYGETGGGPFPPKADIIFDLELTK